MQYYVFYRRGILCKFYPLFQINSSHFLIFPKTVYVLSNMNVQNLDKFYPVRDELNNIL